MLNLSFNVLGQDLPAILNINWLVSKQKKLTVENVTVELGE